MFLRCYYFFAKSEADVLINSVLTKRKACRHLCRGRYRSVRIENELKETVLRSPGNNSNAITLTPHSIKRTPNYKQHTGT